VIRILLVEDDEMSREMLSRRMRRLGFQVITASGGREGIQTARAEMPDVILMDLCMPEVDGITAVEHLKRDRTTADIPIIALTALTTNVDVLRAARAGCGQYETKPVVLDRLVAKIQKVVEQQKKQKREEQETGGL
jgi:CheY-like chemotaxis protein